MGECYFLFFRRQTAVAKYTYEVYIFAVMYICK